MHIPGSAKKFISYYLSARAAEYTDSISAEGQEPPLHSKEYPEYDTKLIQSWSSR